MKKYLRFFRESVDLDKLDVVGRSKVNPRGDTFPKRVARGDSSVKQIQIGSSVVTYNGSQLIITHFADGRINCETDKDIRMLYKDSEELRAIRCSGETVAYYQL